VTRDNEYMDAIGCGMEKFTMRLQSHPGWPVQPIAKFLARHRSNPRPGVQVFDLGQNIAGWVRLKISGEAGTRIVLRHAEVLNRDGTIYTENLRGALSTDMYYLKGDGEETWEPRFTYHGFRYVEITGCRHELPLDAVTGVAIGSGLPQAGNFECSNRHVNQLFSNIVWSLKGNYVDIPTDCPQRDERMGWTGDAQIFFPTATFIADVSAFFTKWMVDLSDAQNKEGVYPGVAPHVEGIPHGAAGYADAGVTCLHHFYKTYGDKRVIEQHYDSMARWIEYLIDHSQNLLRPAEGYGDWLSIEADTPKDVVSTAYFAYVTALMAELARAIDKQKDAERYADLFERIKDAFHKAYVGEDGRIKGDTQTGYVLSLFMNLLPEEKRSFAVKYLVQDIQARNQHLSTGFMGVSFLNPTLTLVGNIDLAYHLLNNQTFPSWGYQIRHEATTIWERWDSIKENGDFQNPAMNSFNHYVLGSIGQWLFNTVAGIEAAEPGFEHLLIRPRPGGGLDHVKASYHSIRGPIGIEWSRIGRKLKLNLSIPPNVRATVHVPTTRIDTIYEGKMPVKEGVGVRFVRIEDDSAVLDVASGYYKLECEMSVK
jgi:alpha-L-rhamnosidase